MGTLRIVGGEEFDVVKPLLTAEQEKQTARWRPPHRPHRAGAATTIELVLASLQNVEPAPVKGPRRFFRARLQIQFDFRAARATLDQST